ncbi:MAG: hypothetical protein HW388_368 [Dehalococcoidia bacterium]|nr:hypothetical protein [Dehalococcoidia bacterium]
MRLRLCKTLNFTHIEAYDRIAPEAALEGLVSRGWKLCE